MSLEDAVKTPTPQEQADASIQSEQAVAPVVTPPAAAPVADEAEEAPIPQKSEYDSLMERAARMGLRVRSNIGLEKLRERVNAAIAGEAPVADEDDEEDDAEDDDQEEPEVTSSIPKASVLAAALPVETPGQKRARQRNDARKLIRVRITNHNPNKAEHEGEIFTFGNSAVGTIKRYVPFNVEWHVEAAILEIIKERQFQFFQEKKVEGRMMTQTRYAREFAVEVLPALTQEELRQLAQRQAMAAGTQEV